MHVIFSKTLNQKEIGEKKQIFEIKNGVQHLLNNCTSAGVASFSVILSIS